MLNLVGVDQSMVEFVAITQSFIHCQHAGHPSDGVIKCHGPRDDGDTFKGLIGLVISMHVGSLSSDLQCCKICPKATSVSYSL